MDTGNGIFPHNENLDDVLLIINKLAQKAAIANYIYRGEPEQYEQISSSFYRDLPIKPPAGSSVDEIQEVTLEAARRFTFESDDLAILTELQHYGGKTNLIDFTADYHIALFFACDGRHTKDGRIVFLERNGNMESHVHGPRSPVNRVIAQKSIFVRPPSGYIEVAPDDIITIPSNLKRHILDYLRKAHGISGETVYNDLHGFIRYAEIHQDAFMHLLTALANLANGDYQDAIRSFTKSLDLNPASFAYSSCGIAYIKIGEYDCAIDNYDRAIALDPNYAMAYNHRGVAKAYKGNHDGAIADLDHAIALDPNYAEAYNNRGSAKLSKSDYTAAIDDCSCAIELDPENASAYSNRGEIWLHLSEWDNARADFTVAKDMNVDIVSSFHNTYTNVADFEQRNGITLPDDIAKMLGG